MHSIFFDLETTDLSPVGQILNYAFVEVASDWSIKSSLHGKVKISRLQLPNPGSIVATRTDILAHNESATEHEQLAMSKIQRYIQDIVEWNDTRLIGFNSNRFDVPFLRTSFIRNGLNPYFGGSIKYGDVLHVVRRLACDRPDFCEKLSKRSDGRFDMRLESVLRSLNLLALSEQQEHESLADVTLTIKLAKLLHDTYDIDVRSYSSYEPSHGDKIVEVFPYFDEQNQLVSGEYCTMVLLEQNKTQALWINLKKFQEGLGKKAISWYNKNTSAFYVKRRLPSDNALAARARQELSHFNLQNFWPPKNCDVEQFIYMMPIDEIAALYDAVWRDDLFLLKQKHSSHVAKLYLRHLCNTADISTVEKHVVDYALYRYGGRMKLDKDNFDVKFEEGVFSESFHPTYNELLAQIDELSKVPENTHIMSQLKLFYEQSAIAGLAGSKLKLINRRKQNE